MIFPLRDLIHPLQTNLVISRTKSSVIFVDSRDVDGALGHLPLLSRVRKNLI